VKSTAGSRTFRHGIDFAKDEVTVRPFAIVLTVVGAFLALVVLIATLVTVPREAPKDIWIQLLLSRLPQVFGVLVSAVSVLGLLVGGLYRDRLESLLPLALAFLAGLLLISQHWAVALAFGALGVAALLLQLCRRPQPVSESSSLPQENG
jgi:hypothetical protein